MIDLKGKDKKTHLRKNFLEHHKIQRNKDFNINSFFLVSLENKFINDSNNLLLYSG